VSYGHKAANRIFEFEPDVVISANTPLDAQRLIHKASQQVGAKFIFWMQDVISLAAARALGDKFTPLGQAVGLFYQNMERALLHRSDQVIVISGGFLPLLQAWHIPAENIHLIPNWAPVDRITPQPHDNPWSAQMGLAHTFNFLYTGVLGLKHDPSLFLDLGQHFQGDPDVRIVIVSKGERFEWLRAEAHQRGIHNLVLVEFQPSQVYPLILAAGTSWCLY
jgi:colanic acid biosynthesis glycosyl transferase WcaI